MSDNTRIDIFRKFQENGDRASYERAIYEGLRAGLYKELSLEDVSQHLSDQVSEASNDVLAIHRELDLYVGTIVHSIPPDHPLRRDPAIKKISKENQGPPICVELDSIIWEQYHRHHFPPTLFFGEWKSSFYLGEYTEFVGLQRIQYHTTLQFLVTKEDLELTLVDFYDTRFELSSELCSPQYVQGTMKFLPHPKIEEKPQLTPESLLINYTVPRFVDEDDPEHVLKGKLIYKPMTVESKILIPATQPDLPTVESVIKEYNQRNPH